ncbi:spore coat protein CotG [Bacillus paralicheniformis]|uniref:spore coat protein CotG n=1 Tax=Bacillus paralicheniformis TaxID=1648923 RepID=UPI0037C09A11
MSGVHDHDIKEAVDQLKSEGRDHYLDREPEESAGSGKERRPHNIWDLWWGIKPDRSKKHHKSKKHDDHEKPDKSKPDKSKKPDDCKKPDKSKKPDDCKKPDKSKKPDGCKKPDKSKKPHDCKKRDKCRSKRPDHHRCKKTHHHKRGGYETITKWSDGNLTEVIYRKK